MISTMELADAASGRCLRWGSMSAVSNVCRDIRREGPRTGAVHKLVQKFELLTDEYLWEVDYYHKDLPILCKPLFQNTVIFVLITSYIFVPPKDH